jgi:hypothetical protein
MAKKKLLDSDWGYGLPILGGIKLYMAKNEEDEKILKKVIGPSMR